jgi:hypothetical protein
VTVVEAAPGAVNVIHPLAGSVPLTEAANAT